MQISAYISAHNTVYNTSINQGVILLCTKDNFFQRFIIDGERLKEYQNKFFERVEQYYSQKNN
jgi:genome maintenance exonuclease 1